jgi:putative NIF3 family GTP cyclohydrolase 1 type 2
MGRRRAAMTLQTTSRPLVEVQAYLDKLLYSPGLDVGGEGLRVGGRPVVEKVGFAVNCSLQAIEGAIERGCHLLITHHSAQPRTDAHLAEVKYDRLRQSGINLYVAYKSLDCAREFGTADALARAVRIAIQGAFEPDGETAIGAHGTTSGPFVEFVARVGNRLGTDPLAWKNSDAFGHVGVIGGRGARPEWMARAQSLGCDTLLTGEAGMFGLLFAREAGVNLIVTGHYASSIPSIMALSIQIAQQLQLDVTFIPEDIIERKG